MGSTVRIGVQEPARGATGPCGKMGGYFKRFAFFEAALLNKVYRKTAKARKSSSATGGTPIIYSNFLLNKNLYKGLT